MLSLDTEVSEDREDIFTPAYEDVKRIKNRLKKWIELENLSPLPVSPTRLPYPSPLPVSPTRLPYPSPLPEI
jgi:hypothetical protein